MELLVPGRGCGACTVCCTVLALDALSKPAGVPCPHCAKGCAIHPARPDACREFFCAWRMLEIFPDDWRPDLSGVFAQLEDQDIPEQFDQRTGISLMLVGPHPARTLRQRWFIEFVATGIGEHIPLFLSLPGPAGHHAAKLLLNDQAMADAVSDADRIKTALERALKRLQSHEFRKS
jgi:hypothetical protein